jgi:hypothetical protein
MATIDSYAAAPGSNPQVAASNLLANTSGATAVARPESQGVKEKAATSPEPSARVSISENGRARLQAEGANAAATTLEAQAANVQQTQQTAPAAATGAAPDVRNDTMLTATAPTAPAVADAMAQGTSADPASPVAGLAPVASAAPRSEASSGNMTEAAMPASPGTPRAESGRQQADVMATQTQAQQSDNRANQQDMSPVLAQGGVAAYRDIFSG